MARHSFDTEMHVFQLFRCAIFQLIETMCTPVIVVGVHCMFASGMLGLIDHSYQYCLDLWSVFGALGKITN